MNNNLYGPLNDNQLHIDKTASLEKGIVVFPSIYIEGAAASGKTTAVKMLLNNHPEVKSVVFWMDWHIDNLEAELDLLGRKMRKETIWVIFENVNQPLTKELCSLIKKFIRQMPKNGRAIFVGRERPHEELLDLLWKREMELISQEEFLFTRNEIRECLHESKSLLKPDALYEMTGGWPGCVDIMIRSSKKTADISEIRNSFEIDTYIEKEIIGNLSGEERELVEISRLCPWIDETLCADVWQVENAKDTFERLRRKGIFYYNKVKEHYRLNNLFKADEEKYSSGQWLSLAKWYEKNQSFSEAYSCITKSGDKEAWKEFLLRYYDIIPFIDVRYDGVMNWSGNRPEICYLRGMYSYSHQYFDSLENEIWRVKQWSPSSEQEEKRKTEVYVNLMYVNPQVTLTEWLELLEKETKDRGKTHLYSILGTGYSFLCGMRDLSGLFACSKKEESKKAKLWKEALQDEEWAAYCLARFDYYMETKREDSLQEEDWKMLYQATGKSRDDEAVERYRQDMWRVRLAGLYLICKWPGGKEKKDTVEHIYRVENLLLQEQNDLCIRNMQSVVSLYSRWWDEPERLSRWLRYSEEESTMQISESNYLEMFARAKGYLLLNHYEKAEKILEQIIPYLQDYHRYRYLAESLFEMAIVNWNKGKKGQAIRNMMESFLVTGSSRYVGFYVRYGKKGREVLEAYVEWLKQTTPEDWRRKKKYNYGNVLRMPMEDYLEVILRGAKKESKFSTELSRGKTIERLTMMETIILQDISRGLTNTEICKEQNLKMPTVKSHIYSMYKKLGVSTRVQAVNKGKEMGIVK